MSEDRIVLTLTDEDMTERTFEPAAEGWYKVEIEEVEKKTSNSAKNPGKPFYAMTYNSIDHDAHKGKFFGDNIMLWHGAHFSLVSLLKATGDLTEAGELFVPTEDELIGKELEVYVGIEEYEKKDGSGKGRRNVVKRRRSLEAGAKGGATTKAKAKSGKFSL